MPEPLVVVGAGGFGREVLALLTALTDAAGAPVHDVVGVADDRPSPADVDLVAARGLSVLGGVEEAAARHPGVAYVVCVGDPTVRRDLADRADGAGWRAATLVHPSVVLADPATVLGEGTVLGAGTTISVDTVVGRHVQLNVNAHVERGCVVGGFTTLCPAVTLGAGCHLGAGVFVGAGATVEDGLRLGDGAVVGAVSLVTQDVGAGRLVKGVPAS